MDYDEIDLVFQEASKVLHMDSSHDAIRSKIQTALSAQHRAANANSDSSSYYNTPYVRDVYGSEDAGSVVHSKDGKLTASKFKKNAKGEYELSSHKSVKQAYVSDNDADDKKESLVVMIDGTERILQERAIETIESGIIELQEAASGSKSNAKITLITAGRGSMGYYTEEALKKAATDKIFDVGTQMFLNHQTKEERAARPEGDITKLAGATTASAVYVAGESGKPGRLVASANIYPEFKPFVSARKDDIGVSVRVGALPSGKTRDGVPLVESMVYALSADLVTKAGRGGKIDELYESYRANPGERQPAAGAKDDMTEQEQKDFKLLQESQATLAVRLDRLTEENTQLSASSVLTEALRASNLPARGQERVRTLVMVNVPLTTEKTLDKVKFQEAVKTAIDGELAYLKEAGVRLTPKVIQFQGGTADHQEAETDSKEEAKLMEESQKVLDSSIGLLAGRKEKSA